MIRLATTFLPEMGDLFVVKQIIIRRAGQLVDLQSSVRLMESSLDGRLVRRGSCPCRTNAHRSIAGRGFGKRSAELSSRVVGREGRTLARLVDEEDEDRSGHLGSDGDIGTPWMRYDGREPDRQASGCHFRGLTRVQGWCRRFRGNLAKAMTGKQLAAIDSKCTCSVMLLERCLRNG